MIEVEVKQLRDAMRAIMAVVSKGGTIPILANVLITATPSGLVLTGTDMDMEIERHVTVIKGDRLRTTVDAAAFSRIADKLPAEATATIEWVDDKIAVKAGRSRFQLATLPAEDMPVMARPDWDNHFSMPAFELGAALASVRFAISTEEARYYLNGVYLVASDDALDFVATDGHRLARYRLPVPEGAEDLAGIIISRKAVAAIEKLIDKAVDGAEVEIAASASRFSITLGETTLCTKLIDGQYPDYSRVIPMGATRTMRFEPAALAAAVERVTIVSSDKTRLLKMIADGAQVTLDVRSPEIGMAAEDMPVQFEGAAIDIGFNGRYLLDILARLPGSEAIVEFSDAAAPTLWKGGEAARGVFVLMPSRV